MLKWSPYPFIRIGMSMSGGIVLAFHFEHAIPDPLIISICLFLAYLACFFFIRKNRFKDTIMGFTGLSALFFIGYAHMLQRMADSDRDHLIHQDMKFSYYQGVVASSPEEKANSYRYVVKVEKIKTAEAWRNVKGKILLYIKKQPSPQLNRYGDKVLIRGMPDELASPSNPHSFDFKAYMRLQNIYHQHFVKNNDVYVYENETPGSVIYYASLCRQRFRAILKKHIRHEKAQAVALALILGVRDNLDKELKASYAAAGAMHILAVSGLHVGIVYGILLLLLGKMQKKKHGKWFFALLCLLALWAYALITGFSSSVLRAVTMFSFFIIAKATQRQTNTYNTLAASAVFLLCYKPQLIMSVGFQLSYLAVAGILYLQPKLYALMELQNYILDKVWALTCVSLAAQVATFPISLYYFHQFPTYFFVANLVVIPAAFLMLCLGMLTLVVSFSGLLANVIGFLLESLIRIVNYFVGFIEQLPFSQATNLYINGLQTWFIYGFIIAILALLYFRRFIYMVYGFCFVLAIFITNFKNLLHQSAQRKIIFYNIDNQKAVDFIHGKTAYLVADGQLKEAAEQLSFHINPARLTMGLKTGHDRKEYSALFSPVKNLEVGVWLDQKIVFIAGPFHDSLRLKDKTAVDFLVISNNAVENLNTVLPYFSFKTLIIDSSNKKSLATTLKKQAENQGIKNHVVGIDGALIIDL